MDKFDPSSPETEEDAIRAEALRRLKVRRLFNDHPDPSAVAEGLTKVTSSNESSTLRSATNQRPMSGSVYQEQTMDLLAKCISDLETQLQEWLGSNLPAEGTEDFEIWQMKIQLIEQVESIADIYDLCEGGDFNLPSVLEDDE